MDGSFYPRQLRNLRRLKDEHFDVADLEASFAPERADKSKAAAPRCDIIMIIGGCYYWTLRSIAGDGAHPLIPAEQTIPTGASGLAGPVDILPGSACFFSEIVLARR